MILVVAHHECNHHPNQRRVPTDLPKHVVERFSHSFSLLNISTLHNSQSESIIVYITAQFQIWGSGDVRIKQISEVVILECR